MDTSVFERSPSASLARALALSSTQGQARAVTTVELLEQLLRCAETRDDASALLHERVVLERLDGEVLRGRAVVVDAVLSRDQHARLEVLARDGDDALRVGLFVEGVSGHLRFMLRGASRDGLLLAITMEPC